jgi:type IV pilus assembly protein PilV
MTPHQRHRTAGKAAGFTLVEFMVALTVFAIGVLGIALVFMNGTRHVGASGEETKAVELAQQGLEDLLTESFDSVNLDPGTHWDADNPLERAYYRDWSVEDQVPFTGCKRVTVNVRWPGEHPTRTVTLVGIKAQAGH